MSIDSKFDKLVNAAIDRMERHPIDYSNIDKLGWAQSIVEATDSLIKSIDNPDRLPNFGTKLTHIASICKYAYYFHAKDISQSEIDEIIANDYRALQVQLDLLKEGN